MCQFILEDGERCGNDQDPFCWQHEDTPQAYVHESMESLKEDLSEVREMLSQVESGDMRASSTIEMETSCDECGASLRRCERLTPHEQQSWHVVFEAYVECDCGEHVLGRQPVRRANIPAGWTDD